MAGNAATDHLRRKKMAAVSLDSGPPKETARVLKDFLADRAPDPLERLVVRETRREILLSIKGLPRIYRRIV